MAEKISVPGGNRTCDCLVRRPVLNPLSTCRLFHCYMLKEYICHFRGVGFIRSPLFYMYFEENLIWACTVCL